MCNHIVYKGRNNVVVQEWKIYNEKNVLNTFVVNSVLATSLSVILRNVFNNVTQPVCDVKD